MDVNRYINIWTESQFLNVVIWLALLVVILYLAKNPVHKTIRSLCLMITQTLSRLAEAILSAVETVRERNREVLLTAGLEQAEKKIETEFVRINTLVERDLSGFPVLKRQLQEQVARIEDDYRQSSEIPPSSPGWVDAISVLSKLPDQAKENKAIAKILNDIHISTCGQHTEAMAEYRNAVGTHHEILNSLKPYWQKLSRTLEDVSHVIKGIRERSVKIDRLMDQYEAIRGKTNRAESALTSSSIIRFVISGIALAIAMWAIVVNFNLIAIPMQEMIGGNSYIGVMKTSDVVALVINLLEVSIGIYLMDALRITDLFPVIRQMDERMRGRLIWFAVFCLLGLACVQASFAFIREKAILEQLATLNALNGTAVLQTPDITVTTMGQMTLSFVLPFILTLTAIPFESFIQSSRIVLGQLTVLGLRMSAFLLSLSGTVIHHLGELIVNVYNLTVFPLIWAEDMLVNRLGASEKISVKTDKTVASSDHSNEINEENDSDNTRIAEKEAV